MSVPNLSAAIASFIAGSMVDKIGRKKSMILGSFAFTLGSVLMAFPKRDERYLLLTGRIIVGVGIGKNQNVTIVDQAQKLGPICHTKMLYVMDDTKLQCNATEQSVLFFMFI